MLMALELRDALGALTQTWNRLGHEIGFGIGIAHGFATLGTTCTTESKRGHKGARSDRKIAGHRGKGSEPSRRLSLVICFRATRRVGAKTRHLVGLALSCGTVG
jgi:hypothetical protein